MDRTWRRQINSLKVNKLGNELPIRFFSRAKVAKEVPLGQHLDGQWTVTATPVAEESEWTRENLVHPHFVSFIIFHLMRSTEEFPGRGEFNRFNGQSSTTGAGIGNPPLQCN